MAIWPSSKIRRCSFFSYPMNPCFPTIQLVWYKTSLSAKKTGLVLDAWSKACRKFVKMISSAENWRILSARAPAIVKLVMRKIFLKTFIAKSKWEIFQLFAFLPQLHKAIVFLITQPSIRH